MRRIKELPEFSRPREKLKEKGAQSFTVKDRLLWSSTVKDRLLWSSTVKDRLLRRGRKKTDARKDV